MRCEIRRVGHAVAVDVRAGGIFRIGPKVVGLGKIIVRAAGAARAGKARDGYGPLPEVTVGGGEDAAPVDFGDIGNLTLRALAKNSEGRGSRRQARHGAKFSSG